ncbi:hypothetical protein ACYKVK_004623 [Enterobacter hormaechei]|nr:hypothetical protein [Enterobacter hormaechei]
MIGTAKEIAIEMLRDDDNDGEKFVFASWSRNDIRGLCIDWDLSDEEIDVVMERLEAEHRNREAAAHSGQRHPRGRV